MFKKMRLIVFSWLIGISGIILMLGCSGCDSETSSGGSGSSGSSANSVQYWDLTSSGGTVRVKVPSGVTGSVFDYDSGAWVVDFGGCTVNLFPEGTISGDIWRIQNTSNSGCNGTATVHLVNGVGRSNNPYPDGTSIHVSTTSGTLNIIDPIQGAYSSDFTWEGRKVQ